MRKIVYNNKQQQAATIQNKTYKTKLYDYNQINTYIGWQSEDVMMGRVAFTSAHLAYDDAAVGFCLRAI